MRGLHAARRRAQAQGQGHLDVGDEAPEPRGVVEVPSMHSLYHLALLTARTHRHGLAKGIFVREVCESVVQLQGSDDVR